MRSVILTIFAALVLTFSANGQSLGERAERINGQIDKVGIDFVWRGKVTGPCRMERVDSAYSAVWRSAALEDLYDDERQKLNVIKSGLTYFQCDVKSPEELVEVLDRGSFFSGYFFDNGGMYLHVPPTGRGRRIYNRLNGVLDRTSSSNQWAFKLNRPESWSPMERSFSEFTFVPSH